MLKNVLITSASKKIPFICSVQNAAKRINPESKVIAGDINPECIAKYIADDFWEMPLLSDLTIDSIIQYCELHEINVIIPTRDGELEFWAKNLHECREGGISVIVSPIESVKNCLDKLAFSLFGQENKLSVIPASENPDDILSDRYVVKERFGAGSRNIGLNLSKSDAMLHAIHLENPIYQPYIEGTEISVDGWVSNTNDVKGVVLRTRDSIVNGESEITTTFRNPSLEKKAMELLKKLNLRGPVVIQAIVNADGEFNVIECNSRFGGASTASIKVGLDSLYWSLLEACDVDVGSLKFSRFPKEIRQVRIPYDLYFEI